MTEITGNEILSAMVDYIELITDMSERMLEIGTRYRFNVLEVIQDKDQMNQALAGSDPELLGLVFTKVMKYGSFFQNPTENMASLTSEDIQDIREDIASLKDKVREIHS